MKQKLFIILLILLLLPFVTALSIRQYFIFKAEHVVHKVEQCDASLLLAACREMIMLRDSYRNDLEQHSLKEMLPKDCVYIDIESNGMDLRIPDVLQKLDPVTFEITNERIIIHLLMGPQKVSLVGYVDGVGQGNIMLIKGLWILK